MRQKKIEEAKVQLDNKIHNKPRRAPIVKNRQGLMRSLTKCIGANIDDTTNKWLSQTLHPPRRSIFYTLTKTDKTYTGR